MQLVEQSIGNGPFIRGTGRGVLVIGDNEWRQPVWVQPGHAVEVWSPPALESFGSSEADALSARQPAVVILGTGESQRFAPPAFAARLLGAGIGLECMPNAAAARTYNLLAGEGRVVLAAFLFD